MMCIILMHASEASPSEKRNELKLPQTAVIGPMQQSLQAQANTEDIANNQLMMAQSRAILGWAAERNIDLTHPPNANLVAQVWQSARLAGMQEPNEASTAAHRSCLPSSKQQALSLPSGSENPAAHGKSLADHSVQAGTVKKRRTFSSWSMSGAGDSSTLVINSSNIQMQKPLVIQNKENQNDHRAARTPLASVNGGLIMHPPQSSAGSTSQTIEHSNAKRKFVATQTLPIHVLLH